MVDGFVVLFAIDCMTGTRCENTDDRSAGCASELANELTIELALLVDDRPLHCIESNGCVGEWSPFRLPALDEPDEETSGPQIAL